MRTSDVTGRRELRLARRNRGWRTKAREERNRRRLASRFEHLEERAMMAVIDVTTFADVVDANDGYISLREAINTANSNGENDTINLPAGTYEISLSGTHEDNNVRGDFDVKESGKSVTFAGAGSNLTIIDANFVDRVFDIKSGVTATFNGLTIREGDPVSGGNGAGMIAAGATLTLNNCIVTACTGSTGGALYLSSNSTLVLTGTTLSGNSVTSNGGAIYASGGSVTIDDSEISGNSAGPAGGIYLSNSSLTISDSVVSENTASTGPGAMYLASTPLNMTNTQVINNTGHSIGGIMFNSSTASIANSTISGNYAGSTSGSYVGGIRFAYSAFTMTDSQVSENESVAGGGGISIYNAAGNSSITGSVIQGNIGDEGGGIDAYGANTLSIIETSIVGNQAVGGPGGGINSQAAMIIERSTISGNSSTSHGGGIYSGNLLGLTMTNTTVSGNSTSGTGSDGGGLYIVPSSVGSAPSLINSTITANTAVDVGGGIRTLGTSFKLQNTIVAGNTAGTNGSDLFGTFNSQDYNLIQSTTGATINGTTTNNIYGQDPLLGPLQDNGGPTHTHAIAYNSPALDAGTNTGAPSTDQRGVSRPQDGDNNATATVDIGAYEYRYNSAPVNTVPGSQVTDEDQPVTFSVGNGNLISIADAEAGSQSVQVALTGTHGTITLSGTSGLTFTTGDGTGDATMTFTGTVADINAALAGLQFLPTANYSGSASLQIVTNDQGAGSDGSALSDDDSVNITVDSVNDAPVNSVPGLQTFDEDTTLTFSSGNGNLISISDVDAGGSTVQVTVTVTHGTFTLSGVTGLSFTAGDGTADTTMTFTGSISDINAALAGSVYTPTTDYYGSASLEIVTNDLGNAGSGGALGDTDEVEFTIEEVDSTPYVLHPIYDLLVVENAPNTFITLSPYFDDADIIPLGDSLTFTVQANDNTSLVTATIVDHVLQLAYAADETGTATITIRATDDFNEYVDETFVVTVGSGCCGGNEELELMTGGGEGSGSGFGFSSASLESLEESSGEFLYPLGGGTGGAFLVASGGGASSGTSSNCPGCLEAYVINLSLRACCTDLGSGSPGSLRTSTPHTETLARDGENVTRTGRGPMEMSHRGPDNPHPIISTYYAMPGLGDVPLMLEAKLTFGGIEGDPVFFDTSGLALSDVMMLSLQIDATGLETGFYEYTIDFTEHYTSSTLQSSFTDRYAIHNRSESEFGNRWWLTDLDALDIHAEGVGLIRGNSSGAWFESDGFGGFEPAAASFETLAKDEDDWYTVTTQWGDRSIFDDCGRLRLRIDAHGNTTTYAYWDARQDGSADEIAFITDPFGRTTSFFYTDGLLASATDFAGNVTTYTYVDGRLTTITYPDPDGQGPEEAPATNFTYTTEGWLESYTDGDGQTASFEYDFAGRLSGGTGMDGSTWTLTPEVVQTLVDPSSGLGTALNPAPAKLASEVFAEYSGPGTVDESIQTDIFGQPVHKVDALGHAWFWTYDSHGRMLTATTPDPDGAGPLGPQTTTYTYGSLSLPLTVTYADSTTETFTYDATFQRMTSHTDRLGRVTLWEIDPANGNVLSETRVVGELDNEINEETDDVVTTFTYTTGLTGVPAGLLLTITDPLGRVTLFNYYGDPEAVNYGRLHYVTEAFGEVGVAAATFFDYDAAGNVVEIVDPLERVTTFAYDALNRLVSVTYPDPDGAGELESPVWSYTYTAGGDLLTATDALGNATTYLYDDQHRVIGHIYADPDGAGPQQAPEIDFTIDARNFVTELTDALGRLTVYDYDDLGQLLSTTLPDPDGGGPLAAPTTSYTYDAVGNLSTVTDALGNVTSYRYDTMNRLVELTLADPDGAGLQSAPVIEYDYDAAGQLIAVTDPLGRVTEYEYDTLGRLVKLTLPDPDGGGGDPAPETDYAYDKVGNLLSVTDALGNVTTYAYDARNRLLSVTQPDPDGGGPLAAPETTYTYDAASQLLTVTDPLGRETSYDYDGLGRLIAVTLPDPDGAGALESPVFTYEYDAVGNLLVETDALGNETAYAYDNLYRLIEVTQADPDGVGALTSPVTTYEYDSMGQLLSMTDPLGRETTYTYDNLGRMLTTTLPDPDGGGAQTSPVSTFEYDAVGNLLSVTDALGNETAYAYDDLHRLLTVTQADPDGGGAQTSPVTTYEYDSASQLLSVTDPLGRETAYAYDGLGRRISVTQPDPDGGGAQTSPVTTFEYDLVGNLLVVTDSLSNETAYQYDNLYRRTRITDALDGETDFTYDTVGNLLSLTDPEENTTEWVYDGLNRVIEETNEFEDPRHFEFDAVGNLIEKTDRLGRVSEYEYDNLHRLIEERWMDGVATVHALSYEYDAAGQLLSAGDSAATYEYTYDGLGRAIEIGQTYAALAEPVTFTQEFDALGNRTLLAATLDATEDFQNEYFYDDLYRLTRVTQDEQSGGYAVAEKRIDFAYNSAGQFDTLTRYADLAGTDLVATSTATPTTASGALPHCCTSKIQRRLQAMNTHGTRQAASPRLSMFCSPQKPRPTPTTTRTS